MIPLWLLLNVVSTWFMCGLIWFVQVVHYPAFCEIGSDAFAAYHRRHTRRTTAVVFGPMLVELISTIALVASPVSAMKPALAWIGMLLVIVIWSSTVLLQIPQHDRLAKAFDGAAHLRLRRTNWVRTIAWSARGVLLLICVSS